MSNRCRAVWPSDQRLRMASNDASVTSTSEASMLSLRTGAPFIRSAPRRQRRSLEGVSGMAMSRTCPAPGVDAIHRCAGHQRRPRWPRPFAGGGTSASRPQRCAADERPAIQLCRGDLEGFAVFVTGGGPSPPSARRVLQIRPPMHDRCLAVHGHDGDCFLVGRIRMPVALGDGHVP